MKSRDIATLGLLAATALILGYVEQLVALSPIPGVKLGVANTVLLYALYLLGGKQAWLLMGLKVLLSGLLFSGPFAMAYSLIGGVLSIAAMTLGRRIPGVGVTGVSVLGATAHNLGQLLVACLVVGTGAALSLAPLLLFSAVAAGVVTGLIAKLAIRHLGGVSRGGKPLPDRAHKEPETGPGAAPKEGGSKGNGFPANPGPEEGEASAQPGSKEPPPDPEGQ